MNRFSSSFRVAVIGAGIAGATCARALSLAGCTVHVVDKSRGAGGRLATRRLEWLDERGQRRVAKVDHGAPAITARGADFLQFLAAAAPPGALVPWTPTLAAGSRPLDETGTLWLPTPDMPSLCRGLLRDIPATWSFAVDRLLQRPARLADRGGGLDAPRVLRCRGAGAAAGAGRAAAGAAPARLGAARVARLDATLLDADGGGAPSGERAGLGRRTARAGSVGLGSCAVTADPAASLRPMKLTGSCTHAPTGAGEHVEQPADWVRVQMQAAMQDWLGEPIEWQHAVVHRWRYAMPQSSGAAPARQGWWDGARGLGVCGDFFGGTGVEGAWQSAQALFDAMLRGVATAPASPTLRPSTIGRRALRLINVHERRDLPRQQGRTAEQALRGLRPSHELAQALGQELGRGEVLQRRLPAREGGSWLSCVRWCWCWATSSTSSPPPSMASMPSVDAVWMAEVADESTHVWSSRPRTVMFLAAMRHFALALQAAGRPLHYTRLDAPGNRGSLAAQLQADIERLRPAAAGHDGAGRLARAAGHQGRGRGLRPAAGDPRGPPLLRQRARVRGACARPQVAAHGVLLSRATQAAPRVDGPAERGHAARRPVELRRRQSRGLRCRRPGHGAAALHASSPMP